MLFKPQPWQKQVSLFKVKVQNHLKKAFPRLLYPAAAAAAEASCAGASSSNQGQSFMWDSVQRIETSITE